MFSKLIFNSPWYYAALCVIFAFFLSGVLYLKNKKNSDVPGYAVKTMFFLRFLSVSLILLLLLNIFLKKLQNETQQPIILLAIDNSRSMTANADSDFIKKDFVPQLKELKKNISRDFEVKTILFSETSQTKEDDPDFSGKETDINNLLSDIENNYSNQNVGALILVSDGIFNKGANPVYNSEKLGYPIYTVGMGDTSEVKDVMVQKVNHNKFAYLGNVFPVEVLISAKKFQGKEVVVTLSEEGKKKGEQRLKIGSDNFLSSCNFTLNADEGGVQKYTVNVSVLEGEKNISNNSRSFLIEVVDNRYKILFLTNFPHPDIAAINEVISNNSSYELKYSSADGFNGSLKPYNLVIIHGYAAVHQKFTDECKNSNIPYWIINPVSPGNLPGIRIGASSHKQNDAEPLLNNSFGLFKVSDELKKFIKDLPAVKTFLGSFSVSNGVNSLLFQKIGAIETEYPVFTFSELDGVKNSVFIGDGLWRWKMRDFAEHNNTQLFNELISKSVQYLSVKSDKSFFRVSGPTIINENETAEITAEVYNKSYELITEPDVLLTLTNPEKKQFNFTFSKVNDFYKLNVGHLPAGDYKYEAKVKTGNELFTKKGSFTVREIVAEKLNTVADHQLLFRLSNNTGGKLYHPAGLKNLEEDIRKNQLIKPITYSTSQTTTLIELKWLFYILLFVLTAEWFFRKRYISI